MWIDWNQISWFDIFFNKSSLVLPPCKTVRMVQQRTMPVFMEQRAQNTDSLDILYVISWYFKVILILVFSLAESKILILLSRTALTPQTLNRYCCCSHKSKHSPSPGPGLSPSTISSFLFGLPAAQCCEVIKRQIDTSKFIEAESLW